jgi:hypothetical protein
MSISLIVLFLAGAFGALAKDVIQDNKVSLPKKNNGDFYLGFCGGMLSGGFVGLLADHNPTTAFFAGYAGTAIIENLIISSSTPAVPVPSDIEGLIRSVALRKKVDPDLAVRVARCESGLNPKAINVNVGGSRDRGLYQINEKYHPEVSESQAFDPEFSVNFFCDAVLAGKLSWWDASKKCWNK